MNDRPNPAKCSAFLSYFLVGLLALSVEAHGQTNTGTEAHGVFMKKPATGNSDAPRASIATPSSEAERLAAQHADLLSRREELAAQHAELVAREQETAAQLEARQRAQAERRETLAEVRARADALRAEIAALEAGEAERQAQSGTAADAAVMATIGRLTRSQVMAHVWRGHFDELRRHSHTDIYLAAFSRLADRFCREDQGIGTGLSAVTLEIGMGALVQGFDPQFQMSVLDTVARMVTNPEQALISVVERELATREGPADAQTFLVDFPECRDAVNQRLFQNIAAFLTGRPAPFADPLPRDTVAESFADVRPVSVTYVRRFVQGVEIQMPILTYRGVPDGWTPHVASMIAELESRSFRVEIEGRRTTHHLFLVRAWQMVPLGIAERVLDMRFRWTPEMSRAYRELVQAMADDPEIGVLECHYVSGNPGTYLDAYYWHPRTPRGFDAETSRGSPIHALLRQLRPGTSHCPLWYEGRI